MERKTQKQAEQQLHAQPMQPNIQKTIKKATAKKQLTRKHLGEEGPVETDIDGDTTIRQAKTRTSPHT